jgi:nitroreductase
MSKARQNPVDHPVTDSIQRRWSPVAFLPEPLDDATLNAVFEGARWAASAFNEQPWRFVIARRDDPGRFGPMLECLVEFNRAWAQHAAVVAIVCAMKSFSRNGDPNAHAWFDTGQATAQLALSAVHQGLYCHAMGGFSAELARKSFGIGPNADPVCALAIGKLGDGTLLDEATAGRDASPRVRHGLGDIVFEGSFGQAAGFASS